MFATYNGSQTLPAVLDGYARLAQQDAKFHLCVVDNRSVDDTQLVLDRYRYRIPMDVLFCADQGKNKALNHGLSYAPLDGELIVFTDDDSVPKGDFIEAWTNVTRDAPSFDLFGGTVLPAFPSEVPAWLSKYEAHFNEIYAANSRDRSQEIGANEIFGPNMAVRTSILRKGFRFNEDIGPNSAQAMYAMGSETEFCVRVQTATSCRAWFDTRPVVDHIVRPWQMERDFIDKRAFRHGAGYATRNPLGENEGHTIVARTRRSLKNGLLSLGAVAGSEAARWEKHWRAGYQSVARSRSSGR